tara:strand:+ start:227 stop:385 length:159 start_codon:yes stop_codon:yes gene_type:complete
MTPSGSLLVAACDKDGIGNKANELPMKCRLFIDMIATPLIYGCAGKVNLRLL